MGIINLGSIVFDGFEVPSRVEFGGKQQLIVHRLIGGTRVIDTLGRDDAALTWSGVLSGVEAADRARTLDAMRAAGSPQLLTWNAFCYTVVISQLRLSFCSPWWIPYKIDCAVQQDLAQSAVVYSPSSASSIFYDLEEVGRLLAPSVAVDPDTTLDLLSLGASGQQQALASTTALETVVSQGIRAAESSLQSDDVSLLVSSAGSLAQLCCAQGYVGRCAANITNASFQ